jgi:hypothetical protein
MERKELFMKSLVISIHRFSGFVLAPVFVLSLAGPVWAQGSSTSAPPGAGPPPNINPRREDRGRQLQEGRLRSAEMDAVVESENEKHIKVAISHMREDFTRIQVLRNDIARNLVARKPLDYPLVSQQTGEIYKRSSEMNVYMLAHAAEDKEEGNPVELQSEEMIGALVKLCKLIDSFTENPALKNAGTVDVNAFDKVKEEKARADKDLLAIIKLSETIRRKADSLRIPK